MRFHLCCTRGMPVAFVPGMLGCSSPVARPGNVNHVGDGVIVGTQAGCWGSRCS